MSATLGELAQGGLGVVRGDGKVVVRGVRHDSRAVEPGDLFVALSGAQFDGTKFVSGAIDRGASAIAAETTLDVPIPQLTVVSARRSLGALAAVVYGDPTACLAVVGITGTNGKTTTAWLLEAMLARAGCRPALMGTVAFRGPGLAAEATFTTPEGDDLARFARQVVDHGGTHLVMEVSSHALAQYRADAVHFKVGAFSNLTQDHLDFHGTLDAYGKAKARLFLDLSPSSAVINIDDSFGADLAREIARSRPTVRLLRCSARDQADAELRVLRSHGDRAGITGQIATPDGLIDLRTPLVGQHNLDNVLLAVGCGIALGLDAEAMRLALAECRGAPGRLERVDDPRQVAVLVDYAHTPDALERAIGALRPITPGRLFVVFGCGGDRDRDKRPKMGTAAASADLCVVTSDNPRTEDPDAIVAQIEPGLLGHKPRLASSDLARATSGYTIIVDRREAIGAALAAAGTGDTVLIAGKGHEAVQIVGTERRPFDDRQEARSAIASLARGNG